MDVTRTGAMLRKGQPERLQHENRPLNDGYHRRYCLRGQQGLLMMQEFVFFIHTINTHTHARTNI